MVKSPSEKKIKKSEKKFGIFNYPYYICVLLIFNTIIMSDKLKIQSTFVPTERPTFNEWVIEKNVSGMYVEPTQYYPNNPTTIGMMYIQPEPSFFSKLIKLLTK